MIMYFFYASLVCSGPTDICNAVAVFKTQNECTQAISEYTQKHSNVDFIYCYRKDLNEEK